VLGALCWSGSALATAPVQLTIPMSDGAQLACSLIEPDGTLRKVYLEVTPKGHAAEVLADVDALWG